MASLHMPGKGYPSIQTWAATAFSFQTEFMCFSDFWYRIFFHKTNYASLYFFHVLATGLTATGTLPRPRHPAALTSVTVTMLLAGEWPQWQQPRATPVTWTMTQSLCPLHPHPEASTCQQRRTMKAAPLLHTQRGVTPTTSIHHRPPPARTPPEEGPSSSDCLHREM